MRRTEKLRKKTRVSKSRGKTLVDASPKKPAREAGGSKGFAVTQGQWEELSRGCYGRVKPQHGKPEVSEPRKQIELLQAFCKAILFVRQCFPECLDVAVVLLLLLQQLVLFGFAA